MLNDRDITIVGAGIVGCLLFYELAKKYGARVRLLEANEIAAGTTGLSGGFVDLHQRDIFNQQCAEYAFQYYKNIAYTADIGFKEIFCRRIESYMATTSNAMILDAKKLCLYLVSQAQLLGSQCITHHKLDQLAYNNGRVSGQIILACGAGTAKLCYPLLLNISHQAFQFNIYKNTMHLSQALIAMDDDFYVIPKINGHLVCGFLSKDITCDPLKIPIVDDDLTTDIHRMLVKHYPDFKEQECLYSKTAMDVFTADERGLFASTAVKGLFVATGLSAHGITLAPQCVVQFINQWEFNDGAIDLRVSSI